MAQDYMTKCDWCGRKIGNRTKNIFKGYCPTCYYGPCYKMANEQVK